MRLGEAMYQAQQAEAGAEGEAPDGGDPTQDTAGEDTADDVVDADFEEVDDQDENRDKSA